MPAIWRSCGKRIPGRRLKAEEQPQAALLLSGVRNCAVYGGARQLQDRQEAEAQAIIVYNQHAAAIARVAGLEVAPAGVFTEIRQDTRGVPGPQACRQPGRATGPLELLDE